ncbi:hypothetical protein [Hyalangium minutum]|nr:hypothetical protein [Hyalangium minutum]
MSRSIEHASFPQHGHAHSWRGLLLGLALCLLPVSARAAPLGDAQTYLLSAKRLYEGLDYEAALTQIQLARQVPRNRDQELTLLLYEGILLSELNRWDEGAASFKTALELDTAAKLPVQVPPKVSARFESLREKKKRELAAQVTPAPALPSPTENPSPPTEAASPASLPPSIVTVTDSPSPEKELHSYSLIPAIAGGSLVVAGGVSWALSRGELNRLRTASPSLTSEEDVRHSVSRGRTLQTLGMGLLGAGTAGLLTAAGMYMLGGPSRPTTIGVGTTGQAVILYGDWP